MISIPLTDLKQSPLNPRKHFNKEKIDELAASMKTKGILQPLVVRVIADNKYEIVCGARRFRAAKVAELKKVPVIVQDLTDEEVMEIQLIENSQREDIHPLEEAEGYFTLSRRKEYNAEKIATKIGRSEKYVYDRVKLYVSLIKEAKEHFIVNDFTAGHAILLARLSPADQKRALDYSNNAIFLPDHGQYELPILVGDIRVKARSVREFKDWIDSNVRFQRDDIDPMLFPETVKTLTVAKEKEEKIVPITEDHYIQTSARAKERTIGPQSWKRADGKMKSKTCEHSVLGVFVAGHGRGETLKVCIAKEKCKIHWGQWQKERAHRAKARGSVVSSADKIKEQKAMEQREEEQRKRKERRDRYSKAVPLIYKALSEKISKMPISGDSEISRLFIKEVMGMCNVNKKHVIEYDKTSEGLIRFVMNLVFANEVEGWRSNESFPPFAKKHFGIDVWKIIDKNFPAAKPKEKGEAKKKKVSNKKKK
ncbi:MAG: ParB/RepB/Spo0J family partition protein [Candidatus Omnitrophica bacterium]|nr:ParB/RepB/Spo0J family partition protein [Candidatus Omnitrophota bacterium]